MLAAFKVTKFIAKLVTGLAAIGTILVSIAQIYLVQSNAATSKIFTDPEAVLLVQFKPNIKTRTIISELPKNQNYGIVYANTVVTVNKSPFPVEQTGQFTYSNIEKSVKSETDSFIKNLEYAKNKGTKDLKILNNQNLDKGAKETLQTSLNKFTLKDLKSKTADDYYKSANSQIMILVGYQKELNSIKSRLSNQKKNSSNANYIDNSYLYTTKEIKAKQAEIKNEIEKLKKKGYSEEKATREVMKKFLSQYLNKDQLTQIVDLPKDTIAKVNKIIKTDIAGNKFTIEKDLKAIKLSEQENKALQSLLKIFNKRPEEVKNDVQSILKTIKKEVPKVEFKKTSAIENLTSLASGTVEVQAWCD